MKDQFKLIPRDEVEGVKKIYGEEDNGHAWPHICDVINAAYVISKKMNRDMNDIVEYACLYHDISLPLGMDRKTHHIDSAKVFLEQHKDMDETKANIIANCIREHRSSVGGCSTIDSEIVSSSDNGVPAVTLDNMIEKLIMRSVRHHLHVDKGTLDEAIHEACNHIKDKYGKHGYAKYPLLYIKLFHIELEKQRKLVESIDENFEYIVKYVKKHI